MPSRSETQQRLIAVVAGAFVTGLALAAITTLLPLHATRNVGLSSAQFARVLSLRMAGITVGVILLGALSDRFGNKRMTIRCLALLRGPDGRPASPSAPHGSNGERAPREGNGKSPERIMGGLIALVVYGVL